MTNKDQDMGFNNGVYRVLSMLNHYRIFVAKTTEEKQIIVGVIDHVLKAFINGHHNTCHRFNSDTDFVRGLINMITVENL